MNWLRFLFGFFVFSVVIIGGLCGLMLLSWSDLSGNERFLAVSGVCLFVSGLCVSFIFRSVSFVREGQIYEPVPSVPDKELRELREDLERNRDKPIVVEPIVSPTKGFRSMSDDTSMYDDDEPEPEPQSNRNILKPPQQQVNNYKDDDYSGVF